MHATDLLNKSKRIIVKFGSAIFTDGGAVRTAWLQSLAHDIRHLHDQGKEIIIVSSGAVALGRTALGIPLDRPSKELKISDKQAAASIGQITLIQAWLNAFTNEGLNISQILLTPSDTEDRRAHLNARSTMQALLEHRIIPVINENDTTATDEIRFGDNDKLAARVAQMMAADLLLILSTTDGLYTDNPSINPKAKHIPLVERITDDYLSIAGDALAGVSTGGMKSKILSAQIAVNAGTSVIISSGRENHPVRALAHGKSTVFPASDTPERARKRWIKAHLKPAGTLMIDAGAETALKNGKSLLPIGVKQVKGTFIRGDAVRIQTESGSDLAIGLVTYDVQDAQKIIGLNSQNIIEALGYTGRDVLVHRNDLVLL